MRVSRPGGGYFLWVELPASTDARDLRQRAVASGVSMARGPMISASGGFTNFLRVSFGHPLDRRALEGIRQVGRLARRE